MLRAKRLVFGLLSVGLILNIAGCYGPFNLTRRLYQWNGQVGTKWEREFVFIIFVWAPVYEITALGDAIVFNSMEFWTGKNPVDPPSGRRSALPKTKRIARGEAQAQLTFSEASTGPKLLIEQYVKGNAVGNLLIEQRDGATVGVDANGHVLFKAESQQDGGIAVTDKEGKLVASYSADQVERLAKGL